MILLFTDFGTSGPYIGQLKIIFEKLDARPVIDLMHDAPTADPFLSSYLLAALFERIPQGAVCLAVVDPGVGSERLPIVLSIAGRYCVGPANGLFEQIERRYAKGRWLRIVAPHNPPNNIKTSVSFHARDIFAPVAAALADGQENLSRENLVGETLSGEPLSGENLVGETLSDENLSREKLPRMQIIKANPAAHPEWPDDCPRIIHIDRFGNAMTGMRTDSIPDNAIIVIGKHRIARARVFSNVPVGRGFYYRNSLDMIEIAVNQGRACDFFELTIGQEFSFSPV